MACEDNLEPVLKPSIIESILDPVLELIMSLAEAYVLSKVEPYNDDPSIDDRIFEASESDCSASEIEDSNFDSKKE